MKTVEFFAAYLHTNLQLKRKTTKGIYTLEWINKGNQLALRQAMRVIENEHCDAWEPILRPLSDLSILDAAKAGYWTVKSYINAIISKEISIKNWNKLINEQFNVFNLPESEYIHKI